ncbi:MAG TPA: hypothetical protein VKS60_16895 [Stellaceae bacterium]|nr:hypothetical protein [Stellaceae bacterium]
MSNHQAEWSAAKSAFFKQGLSGQDVPPEIVMTLSQGKDLGPALKKFDAADSYEKRIKTVPDVLKAKDEYLKDIADAIGSKAATPKGKKALGELHKSLRDIWLAVDQESQPPRPSGQFVSAYRIRQFNLAAGVKPEMLKVDPVLVDVEVEVDKVFKHLLDAGEVGFRTQVLGDVAKEELEKIGDAFQATIMKVDETIKKDPSCLEAKTKEANEVLQYYRKLVEDRVTAAVRAEWDRYLQNKKYLDTFKTNTKMKVVLGTIGAGVAIASAAMSFGVCWMNILAAAKGLAEVAKTIKTASESIDTTYRKLLDDMDHVSELNTKREKGKEKGGKSQKGSKALEAAKELAAGLMPLTKDMLKTASSIDARCIQFSGQVSELESEADKLSGRLEIMTKNLSDLPNRLLSTEQINLNRRMDKALKQMFEQIADLYKRARAADAFAARARKAVATLKQNDSWTAGTAEKLASWGTKGVALGALVNFVAECANHGKALIPS